MKTNAGRILDQLKIVYEIKEYKVDEDDLTAEHVADQIGFPHEQVFKTLVVKGDKTGVLVACIPGNGELDLKALAAVSGNKNAEMVSVKEIQGLTGYIRGGVSPIGMKKKYPTYLDETAILWDCVSISAGIRGAQIIIAPDDLVKAVDAQMAEIARGK
jgi:Cys-tRNA(Pro)/Cys-tRNA(Cys) deacylase